MTKAEEIKIQEVSPESTLGGAVASANAAAATNRLINNNRNKNIFISFLLNKIQIGFKDSRVRGF
jgi:hypothetical protein